MKIRLKHICLLSVLLLLATGCLVDNNSDENEINGTVVGDRAIISEVMKATQTSTLDGISLTVDAFVWRDFQPTIPQNGKNGILSSVTLQSVNGEPITGRFRLTQQFVVNTDEVWIPDFENEDSPGDDSATIRKISRNGPIWEPGDDVQVGVNIEDQQTGKSMLLSVKDLGIVRTD